MADKKEAAKQQPAKQCGCCKPAGKPADTGKPAEKKDAPRPKR